MYVVLCKTAQRFSKMVVPFYTTPKRFSFHTLPTDFHFHSSHGCSVESQCNLNEYFLMTTNDQHLFHVLTASHVSSFVEFLCKAFAIKKKRLFVFSPTFLNIFTACVLLEKFIEI